MQTDWIFQPTDEAMTRIWLFDFGHERIILWDMSLPKIFITRLIPDFGLFLIKESFPLFDSTQESPDIWHHDLPPSRDELIERSRGVDGLLCLLTDKIDGDVMDAIGPQLKVISSMSVGVDHIDVAAATTRGIPVGNTPGVLTDSTADQTFALMLSAARRIPEAERYLRAGKWVTWQPSLLLGADIAGATLGIVGFGRIGQAVAKRAQGFGMRVLFHSPNAESAYGARPADLDTLLYESDFVSIHVPLKPETKHLVNAEFLAKMKPSAVLVNTARGGVLDQTALYQALKSSQIFAAALDVTDPEPLPMDSPLLELENCIIVPHLGSASKNTRDMMSLLAAQNLVAGLKGVRLQNCVNPQVYR
jgi:lactate dehydrogenase-like 2-hydroxyacid dehydrogenase